MKLKIYENEKVKYLEISYWSFLKCFLLGYFGMMLMMAILYTIFAVLLILL